jgi:iron-sulfur cluster repair protein YtfE (RIC family)
MARQKRATTKQENGGRPRALESVRSEAASARRVATTMLVDDHENVRELLYQALHTHDPTHRMDLLGRARREFEIHSRLEEQVLYPALERLGTDWGHRVDDYQQEHHDVRTMLRDLVSPDIDPDDEEDLETRIEEIQESLESHTSDEEENAFPAVEGHFGATELRSLQRRMVQIRETLEAAAADDLDDEDLEADFSEGRDDDPLPR